MELEHLEASGNGEEVDVVQTATFGNYAAYDAKQIIS